LEPGGQYHIRVDSIGYSQFLHVRDQDIGELETEGDTPVKQKDIKDLSKVDPARLSAQP
jgi:hypothetical protein